MLKEVKTFVTQFTLVILDVTNHDFGTYACVAKNPLGESDGTIKLSGMFDVPFNPEKPLFWRAPKLKLLFIFKKQYLDQITITTNLL